MSASATSSADFPLGAAQRPHRFGFVRVAPRLRSRRSAASSDVLGRLQQQTRSPRRVLGRPATRDRASDRRGRAAASRAAPSISRASGAASGVPQQGREAAARRGGRGETRRGDEALRQRVIHARPRLRGAGSRGGSSSAGRVTTTRSPGVVVLEPTVPPCRRATAAASDRPSPEPGRERAPSSRTKRSNTRARSAGLMPGPRSATVEHDRRPRAARRDDDLRLDPRRRPSARHISARCRSDWRSPGRSARGCRDRQRRPRSRPSIRQPFLLGDGS